jgi:2'-5' RNA ligase
MTMPTRRLFIGLMPDAAVRDALVEHQRHWHWRAGSAPTRPERLHLTLHFLGDVDALRAQALCTVLPTEPLRPFELLLRTPQVWPGGIAVLRPDPQPALDDLHARLAQRSREVGLALPRDDWLPHVTLARGAPGALPPHETAPLRWAVNGYALVWSRPGPAPSYEVLEQYGAG